MARFVFEATADRLSPSAVEHYQHQQPKSSIHRSFGSLTFATMLWTIGMVFTNFVDLSSPGIKRFVFATGSLPCGVLAWNASPSVARSCLVFSESTRIHPTEE